MDEFIHRNPDKPIRCPQCGKTHITLSQYTEELTLYQQICGKLVPIKDNPKEPYDQKSRVIAECASCKYHWRLRGVTQVAFFSHLCLSVSSGN